MKIVTANVLYRSSVACLKEEAVHRFKQEFHFDLHSSSSPVLYP